MKYLCIDYGQKRCGIAVSDAGGRLAFARLTLERRTREAFFSDLLRLIAEEGAEAVVIGLPRYGDGSDSLTTRQVRNFAESLRRRCALPMYFMEEWLSSDEAFAMLRESGYSLEELKRNPGLVDKAAAARILESFLNQPEDRRVPV